MTLLPELLLKQLSLKGKELDINSDSMVAIKQVGDLLLAFVDHNYFSEGPSRAAASME